MKNTGTILGVIIVVVLVLLLLGGVGMMGFGGFGMGGMMGGYGGYGGMMGGYGPQGFGFNPIGTTISLVFWALIIGGIVLLVVWLARNAGRTTLGASAGDAPLDILKARYAKGEITKEQFDAIKRDLGA
jgi:putative membrane protein